MSENTERGKGMFDEAAGKVKQAAGDLTGNERLHAEGTAQELGGEARQTVAKGVGKLKGMAEEVGGAIKRGLGDVTDDTSTEVEGEAERLKGQGRQALND